MVNEMKIWLSGIPYRGLFPDADGVYRYQIRQFDAEVLSINLARGTVECKLHITGDKPYTDIRSVSSIYFFEQMTIQPIPKQGKLL